jgi:hypothetical protein
MNAHFAPPIPAWLRRLIDSKPTIPQPQPRCECGRFCKQDKPDITDKLVKDMSAAGIYVPARFAHRGQGGEE